MGRLRVGVVGVGHLGKEHARTLSGLPDVTLVGVADPNLTQAEAVALRCGTSAHTNHRALLGMVDAAVIVAPTVHHHQIAREFLQQGTPLLIEKPLAADLAQAEELVELARRHAVPLQVGHIERFNPAFEAIQQCSLRPRYIHCERTSGFSGRSTDIGVVLDLMIHDLDLILTLTGSSVASVQAMGVTVLGGHEDTAQARLTFANGCVADVSASRVHPSPARTMRAWGAEGYAAADFARRRLTLMQPSAELRSSRIDSTRLSPAQALSLKGELFSRHLQVREVDCAGGDQLTAELQDFVACVRNGGTPRVDGTAGLAAVALATRVLDSIERHAWTGDSAGPCGPRHLPESLGALFTPTELRAA